MSSEGAQPVRDTIVAANDFRTVGIYRAVHEGGNFTAVDDRYGAGIAISKPNSGQHLSIVRLGITKAYIGGAISSKGVQLTVAASGWLVQAGSGDIGIAKALETCSSGDLARVFVAFDRGSLVSA